MCVRESVCERVCVRDERECVRDERECVRESACVREKERICVCV